jgi:hypothetical protein
METAMELDDLKHAWQTLDRRVDAQAALNLHMLRDNKLDKMRGGLRPLVFGQAIQIVAGALVALWGGAFWTEHLDATHLLVAGVLVHAAGISMIGLGAAMQALIARIDYSAPVLSIQRQLAQLRKLYVYGGLAVGLPWWLLWMPFLMVLLKATFDVDLYANAPSVIWLGSAVGVAGLLATGLLLRWASRRAELAQRLEDSAAGGSLRKARSMLEEIARFEQA